MQRRIFAVVGMAMLTFGLGACDQKPAPTPAAAAPATAAAAVPPGPPATVPDGPSMAGPPYNHETGFAYLVATTVDPAVRKLNVYENGKLLGPGEAIHEDIRKTGKGLYSHWNAGGTDYKIYFSTSDNSDPNTNGRTYDFK